jgi:rsbT antagonist protein RsbS
MALYADIPGVAIQLSRGIVVASIQVDLDEDVLARFREELLKRVHESGSQGVILDVSGLDTLDSEEFAALRRIMSMTRLMGAQAVLVGLQPGVVSALIGAEADVEGLQAALDPDAAFALLEPALETRTEAEPESEEQRSAEAGTTPDAEP